MSLAAFDWPAVTAILGALAMVLQWLHDRRRDDLPERVTVLEVRMDAKDAKS